VYQRRLAATVCFTLLLVSTVLASTVFAQRGFDTRSPRGATGGSGRPSSGYDTPNAGGQTYGGRASQQNQGQPQPAPIAGTCTKCSAEFTEREIRGKTHCPKCGTAWSNQGGKQGTKGNNRNHVYGEGVTLQDSGPIKFRDVLGIIGGLVVFGLIL
jgi:predicted RNA-binding Zn-ribbon protein involved in translation (DUF1610 family)